jgi:hypothetical protein
LESSEHVRIAVYDLVGREAAVLLDGPVSAGQHTVTFDATSMPSGTYLVRLQSDSGIAARTITLLK